MTVLFNRLPEEYKIYKREKKITLEEINRLVDLFIADSSNYKHFTDYYKDEYINTVVTSGMYQRDTKADVIFDPEIFRINTIEEFNIPIPYFELTRK
jgi:hypothetical protein